MQRPGLNRWVTQFQKDFSISESAHQGVPSHSRAPRTFQVLTSRYVLMAAGPAPSGEAAFWGIATWDLQEEASASSGHKLLSCPPPVSIKDNPLISEGFGGLGSWTPPSLVPRWGGLQAWAESGQLWGIGVHSASTQHPAPCTCRIRCPTCGMGCAPHSNPAVSAA